MAARALRRALFDAALAAAAPAGPIMPHLPPPVSGRTVVVGAGKASAAMARAFEKAWPTNKQAAPLEGLVVTRHGHGVPCERIRIVEASHPVPDVAGEQAARAIFAPARGVGTPDPPGCPFPGGGSAVLTLPAPG